MNGAVLAIDAGGTKIHLAVAQNGEIASEVKIELAGEPHRAIVLAPSGRTQHLLVNMAKELHQRGSKVVLISDTTDDVPCYKLAMPTIREELAPILYFLPIEFFGRNVSRLRGRIPGMMRHMDKVTVVE